MNESRMEFVWRASPSLGPSTQLFAGAFQVCGHLHPFCASVLLVIAPVCLCPRIFRSLETTVLQTVRSSYAYCSPYTSFSVTVYPHSPGFCFDWFCADPPIQVIAVLTRAVCDTHHRSLSSGGSPTGGCERARPRECVRRLHLPILHSQRAHAARHVRDGLGLHV